jgi:hypothetical protein
VTTVANANNTGGYVTALLGDFYHEGLDPLEGFRTLHNGYSGTSLEDHYLAMRGMSIGMMLANGTLPIEQAGSYMRTALASPYPADNGVRALGTSWWPSKIWEGLLISIFK